MSRFLRLGQTGRSVAILMAGNTAAQVLNIAGLPVLSRIYDPSSFGALAIYVAVSTLVAVVASGRYYLAVVIPEDEAEAWALKRLSERLLVAVSILLLVVLYVLRDTLRRLLNLQTDVSLVPLMALSVFLTAEVTVLNYWCTRHRAFKVQSQSKLVLAAMTVGSQAILGLTVFPDARGLIVGLVIGQLAALLFLWLRHVNERAVEGPQSQLLHLMWKYRKMPLLNGPNALIDSVRMNGVNLVLGGISSHLLGQFSMALRSVQAPVGLIAQSLAQVFLEKMARAQKGELFESTVGIVRRGALIAAVPFGLLFVISPSVFPLFLGDGWEQAGLYAQALVPWLFLNVVSSPLANVFIVTQTQGRLLAFALVYMAVPLVLLYQFREDSLFAVRAMAAALAVLLLAQIAFALWTARKADARSS